jgi:hypothetical protein
MNEQEDHEMVLEITHPSGEEEWYCPTCGRRFMIHWPPNYKKIVLNPGDEFAYHRGGKGGLSMGPLRVTEVEEPVLPGNIRAALEEILRKSGFEDSTGASEADS